MNEAQAGATMTLAKTSEGKAAEIDQLIAPSLCAMGYNIVRVLISGKERRVLQIMAERQSDGDMVWTTAPRSVGQFRRSSTWRT